MKSALVNALMNIVLAVVFVLLSNRALNSGLEETLVSLAFLYGLVVILANAAFTALLPGRPRARSWRGVSRHGEACTTPIDTNTGLRPDKAGN